MKLPRYRPAVGITFLVLCMCADVALVFLLPGRRPWRGFLSYIGFAVPLVWSVYGR